MGSHDEVRIGRLRDAILDYVRRHPDASDTPQGVVRWWLPTTLADGATEMIDDVLKDLSLAGALRCVRLPDGALLYSLATRGQDIQDSTHSEDT